MWVDFQLRRNACYVLRFGLGNHEYGGCVHGDGFGTRSASLIYLERVDGELHDRYWVADGPPCGSEFRRVESRL